MTRPAVPSAVSYLVTGERKRSFVKRQAECSRWRTKKCIAGLYAIRCGCCSQHCDCNYSQIGWPGIDRRRLGQRFRKTSFTSLRGSARCLTSFKTVTSKKSAASVHSHARMSNMTSNLLSEAWTNLDSFELRLLLDERIGRPGQYDGVFPNKLYLPLADSSCRIVLTFRDKKIVAIEPGPAFDVAEWERVSGEIETWILAGPLKIGRDYSFRSFRVPGWWRGARSG